jgi:hypothetical protein
VKKFNTKKTAAIICIGSFALYWCFVAIIRKSSEATTEAKNWKASQIAADRLSASQRTQVPIKKQSADELEDPAQRLYYAGIFNLPEPNAEFALSERCRELLKLNDSEADKVRQHLKTLLHKVSLQTDVQEIHLRPSTSAAETRYLLKSNASGDLRVVFFQQLTASIGWDRASLFLSAFDVYAAESVTFRDFGQGCTKLHIYGAKEGAHGIGSVEVEAHTQASSDGADSDSWKPHGRAFYTLDYPFLESLRVTVPDTE